MAILLQPFIRFSELAKLKHLMPKVLVFFCLIANWPFRPRSRLKIPSLNFTFESEAKRAILQGKKRILKWPPFWNKVYVIPFQKY